MNAEVVKIDAEQRLVGVKLTTGPLKAAAPTEEETEAAAPAS